VGVYVDVLLIGGKQITEIEALVADEGSLPDERFGASVLSYYLGILRGIELYQSAYALKQLEKAGMDNCNASATPMEARLKLSKASDSLQEDDPIKYRSIIGSLHLFNTKSLYLFRCFRVCICFVFSF
jgi:hypothetical protein